MLTVGGTALLEGRFTVDGVLTDPDAVTLRVKDPSGNVTTPAAGSTETGVWTYALALDEAGTWAWEMVGTGAAAAVFGDTFTVAASVIDGGTPAVLATSADVETALVGRRLTADEAARAEQLIAQLVDVLELRLNRLLYPRTVVETRNLLEGERLVLRKGPVRSITSIVVDGVTTTDEWALAHWEDATWPDHVDIVVTYVAGDDPRPATAGAVVDVVARTIQAGVAAGSGSIRSYSVEGTSITYGDVGDGGQGGTGRLTVGDIRSLGRLRRPVLLT